MKSKSYLSIVFILITGSEMSLSAEFDVANLVDEFNSGLNKNNPYLDGTYYINYENHGTGENVIEYSTQDNISQQMEKDMNVLNTLSTIKDDIDQTMKLAKISDIGNIDYEDGAYFNSVLDHGKEVPFKRLKSFQGKGRANDSENSNRLVS